MGLLGAAGLGIAGYCLRDYTYIAADWDSDHDLVQHLHGLSHINVPEVKFHDVHDLTQSRDESLNCSIKASLKRRLDISRTFVLIVSDTTNSVASGSCQYCESYNSYTRCCARGYSVSYDSYIQYECDMAVQAAKERPMDIFVLYKAICVHKEWCPDVICNIGSHIPAWVMYGNQLKYNDAELIHVLQRCC